MSDPQKNLFLDPSQIADGLASDGSDGGSESGRSRLSLLRSVSRSLLTAGNRALVCTFHSDSTEFTPSLTSTNNYINFCLTRNDLVGRPYTRMPIANEALTLDAFPSRNSLSRTETRVSRHVHCLQSLRLADTARDTRPLVKTGSCNAVPMGIIAAANSAPASKFVNPKNLDVRGCLTLI